MKKILVLPALVLTFSFQLLAFSLFSAEKVLFTDDFTKDSGKWDAMSGTWEAQKGEYVATEAVGEAMSVAGDDSWKDYVYELKFKTDEPGSDSWLTMWPVFRVADSDNWYYVLLHHTNHFIELGKRFNGTHTSWLAGAQQAIADPLLWHTMRVECKGAAIKIFVDGKKQIDYTDPEPVLNGKIGIRAVGCTGRIKDLKVTEFPK